MKIFGFPARLKNLAAGRDQNPLGIPKHEDAGRETHARITDFGCLGARRMAGILAAGKGVT